MREMKDTEICWCKNIPSDWSLMRVKDLARLQSGDTFTADDLVEEGLYPVYGGNGLRGYADRYTNDGDHVLIGRQGALCGNINYGAGKFFATEHAIVVYSKKGINVRWLGETLRTANLNRLSMTAAQPGLSVSVINNQFIPCPPEEEQRRIAEYLDSHVSSIDKRVSLLTTKRDHYLRLKTAIINRAVTQGLNPEVKMKDSGVEWIGMIPEHWEIRLFKNVMKIRNGRDYKHIEADEEDELSYPVIGSGGPFAYAKQAMYSGEVLFLGRKGTIDRPLYWNGAFWTVDTMFYAIPTKKTCCRYMYYLSLGFPFWKIGTQTALPSMTQTALNNIVLCQPPLSEQQAIATYLDEKCTKIDAIVENLNQQIEKHKLLKRALINEVITGQRAV